MIKNFLTNILHFYGFYSSGEKASLFWNEFSEGHSIKLNLSTVILVRVYVAFVKELNVKSELHNEIGNKPSDRTLKYLVDNWSKILNCHLWQCLVKKNFITCTNVLFIHSGLFDQNMVVTLKVNIFHYFTTWIVF